MVVKIKKNVKSVILLSIFVFSCFYPILILADPPASISYSWQEESFQFNLDRVWTGDSSLINFTGTYSNVIVTKFSDYNDTDNTMIRETRTSQRELLGADYIFQLGVNELSDTGKQILATYQSSWNINDEGRIVWSYGDCWPIHLFNDARALITWFRIHFLSGKGAISKLSK